MVAESLNFELPIADLDGQVRIDAQVAVSGHENDVGGPWKAFATTSVVFAAAAESDRLAAADFRHVERAASTLNGHLRRIAAGGS